MLGPQRPGSAFDPLRNVRWDASEVAAPSVQSAWRSVVTVGWPSRRRRFNRETRYAAARKGPSIESRSTNSSTAPMLMTDLQRCVVGPESQGLLLRAAAHDDGGTQGQRDHGEKPERRRDNLLAARPLRGCPHETESDDGADQRDEDRPGCEAEHRDDLDRAPRVGRRRGGENLARGRSGGASLGFQGRRGDDVAGGAQVLEQVPHVRVGGGPRTARPRDGRAAR